MAIKYFEPNSVLILILIDAYDIHIAKFCVFVLLESIRLILMKLDLGSVQLKGGINLVVRSIYKEVHKFNPRMY